MTEHSADSHKFEWTAAEFERWVKQQAGEHVRSLGQDRFAGVEANG